MSRPFSRSAKAVLLIGAGLAFSTAVSNVFVSMYLYRWLDDIAALTVFNLGQFVLLPVAFVAASLAARRFGERAVLMAGLSLFVAFYGLLVLLGSATSRFLLLLGVVSGLANGFFFSPYNLIMARIAEVSDKGRFFGASGALGSAATAMGPLVSTLAISLAPTPERGYSLLFLSIVFVTAAMVLAALALPNERQAGALEIRRSLFARGNPRWKLALGISLATGVRDGASWSVMSILILQGAGSEMRAGYMNVGFAVLGIGISYAVGRLLKPRNYSALWGSGSIIAVASALAISLWPSPAGAAVSGVLWKLTESMVFLPYGAVFLGILAGCIREEGGAAGRNIGAEIWLNAGRIIGALSFLALAPFTADYARILFPILTLSLPASWLVYRRYAGSLAG